MITTGILLTEELQRVRSIMGLNEIDLEGRISAAELVQTNTDDVDTLFTLMSKYTPKDYWFVTVGYLNNSYVPVKVTPSPELENMGKEANSDYINSIIDSPDWKKGKMKHPHAARQINKEQVPSTIYKLKSFTCQWLSREARNKMKADRDSNIMAAYKRAKVPPPDVDIDNKRGLGWQSIEGTPFQKHEVTGTQRFAMYRKTNCYTDSPSIYYAKIGESIQKLTPQEVKFLFKMSNTDHSLKMSSYLKNLPNQQLAQELFTIENLYEFKNIDLDKIPFLTCSCTIDNKPVRVSYINKNCAPDGVQKGAFRDFIEEVINQNF